MILGKSLRPKYCLTIEPISIKESGHVESLGITTDKHFSFIKNIENLCRNTNYKLHALRRIKKYITVEKAKPVGNAFIDCQFNYTPLIWMFCQNTLYLNLFIPSYGFLMFSGGGEKVHWKRMG